MKKTVYLLIVTILAINGISCEDSKGSYDYRDINEVAISGLGTVHSVLYKSDTLKITPELNFTMDEETPGRYEYEWKAVPATGNSNPGGVIANTRNLNYRVELLAGSYYLYLKVKDTETGVLWMNYVPVNVRTEIARGFLLIGEDDMGNSNVDMISMMPADTVVLKQLLDNNGLPPLKGPLRIMYTGAGSPSNDPYVYVWLMTEEGSYYLNTQTFEATTDDNFRNKVYSAYDIPDPFHPVHMISKSRANAMSSNRIMLCGNGYAFISNLMNGDFYPNPVNRINSAPNTFFKLFPFIFSAPGNVSGFILYDNDGHRFLRISTSGTYMTELADSPSDIFPWNQPAGRRLVYGENTMNTTSASSGSSFALLKDTDNSFHIYRFYAYSSVSKLGYFDIKPEIATNLNQASLFAFSSTRTLFFYAVGSKLYAYDYNKGLEKVFEKDFGDEITMIHFDLHANTTYNELYVATYNNTTKGTLQKYILGTNQNILELTPDEKCKWSGLVKVKNMDWRNSSK